MRAAVSDLLLRRMATADAVVAFTGAGVSAESGVPTFRGDDGIWKKFRPEELASVDAFMRNPELVWEWYRARRTVMHGVMPNAAHTVLAAMEAMFPEFTVVTQNIDNLHRRAGSRNVVELHGNIERNRCMRCGSPGVPSEEDAVPRCGAPGCTGLLRPDVVWFGEMLPEDEWALAVRAMGRADVVFCIGTSAVVYPAASLPMLARDQGALLVEINPEATPLTAFADVVVREAAAAVMPGLLEAVREARGAAPGARQSIPSQES
jgi:NAD-dependent deacetylase